MDKNNNVCDIVRFFIILCGYHKHDPNGPTQIYMVNKCLNLAFKTSLFHSSSKFGFELYITQHFCKLTLIFTFSLHMYK